MDRIDVLVSAVARVLYVNWKFYVLCSLALLTPPVVLAVPFPERVSGLSETGIVP